MYRRHGDKLAFVFLACDLVVTAASWIGAYWLRFATLPAPHGIPELELVLGGLPLVLLWAAIAYRLCGLYEVHRLRQLPREMAVVLRAAGLLFVLAITTTFYRRHAYESRLALGLFLVLNVAGLTVVRRLLWRALKYFRRRGLNYGRAVILGAGRHGQLVARTIQNNRWTGLEVVGFVEDAGRGKPALLPRLGDLDDLPQIVEKHNIDHVFIALPLSRYGELPRVYRGLSQVLAEVHLVPDVPAGTGMRLRMLEIDHIPFLSLRDPPHHGWKSLVKRAMDVAFGTAALLLAAPVMLLLAAAIKLTSPGPVFYRQRRVGLGGRPFQMLKFRSMRVDAEAETGPVWATPQDSRCTPLGRFMRKWSLDELPQLFNVLAGDMSLVGPRPERDVFVQRFRQQIPNYVQRHRVKAGMTGWAQVNGWRGNTSLRHRVRCDLEYIANWSVAFDLKILLLTLWRGFRHKNAY